MELLEQMVKNQNIALNFQTADTIWPFGPYHCIHVHLDRYIDRYLIPRTGFSKAT